jgi:hypothetical protein
MDGQMRLEVVPAAAVTLLCDLKRDGFSVQLTADDALAIGPPSRLTPELRHAILTHKEALKRLLARLTEADVVQRTEAFAEELAATPAPRVPAFLFKPGVVYAKGTCFSCGDPLPALKFSRCWRCALAWRLACRLPIGEELAAVLDTTKVVA